MERWNQVHRGRFEGKEKRQSKGEKAMQAAVPEREEFGWRWSLAHVIFMSILSSSNVFHLRWETDSSPLQGSLLLSLTTPNLEKFSLWFNLNLSMVTYIFLPILRSEGKRKFSWIVDFIKASRMVRLEGIFENITFKLIFYIKKKDQETEGEGHTASL